MSTIRPLYDAALPVLETAADWGADDAARATLAREQKEASHKLTAPSLGDLTHAEVQSV